jgi:cytochrome c oxidase subunit 2
MSHEVSHGGAQGPAQPTVDNTGKLAGILIGVIAAIAGYLMYRLNPLMSRAASQQGLYIDNIFAITLGIGTVVFVIVQGILLYSIIRFHRQPDDLEDGPPIRGNTRLEVIWTAVPAAVVVLLALWSYQTLAAIETPDPDKLIVEVRGAQYAWQFYYPDYDLTTSEMHLPVDRQAHLKLRSNDVVHSFWVPEFRMKKDVMPDRVTETFITPIEEGVYPIVCAELCGAAHAEMRSQVVVESDGEFEQWVARQPGAAMQGATVARVAAAAEEDPMAAGRQLFTQNGCNACHVLADAGAAGQVGPALDDMGSRAGQIVTGQSAEDYVLAAIVKPNDHLAEGYPANVMPPTYGTTIPQADLDALAKYLLAQK